MLRLLQLSIVIFSLMYGIWLGLSVARSEIATSGGSFETLASGPDVGFFSWRVNGKSVLAADSTFVGLGTNGGYSVLKRKSFFVRTNIDFQDPGEVKRGSLDIANVGHREQADSHDDFAGTSDVVVGTFSGSHGIPLHMSSLQNGLFPESGTVYRRSYHKPSKRP